MLQNRTLEELITFSRSGGATHVNSEGSFVGVDFSTTNVSFGVGSKTFTLLATANNNRDWFVGQKVSLVSQASPLGTMFGTVTSYSAATQQIVVNVTESTGTGSSTNWRIGSQEMRKDLDKGLLIEGEFSNKAPTFLGATSSAVSSVSQTSLDSAQFPNSPLLVSRIGGTHSNSQFGLSSINLGSFSALRGEIISLTYYVSSNGTSDYAALGFYLGSTGSTGQVLRLTFSSNNLASIHSSGSNNFWRTMFLHPSSTRISENLYRVTLRYEILTNITVYPFVAGMADTVLSVTNDGSMGFLLRGLMVSDVDRDHSYFPITTVPAFKPKDVVSLTPLALSKLKETDSTIIFDFKSFGENQQKFKQIFKIEGSNNSQLLSAGQYYALFDSPISLGAIGDRIYVSSQFGRNKVLRFPEIEDFAPFLSGTNTQLTSTTGRSKFISIDDDICITTVNDNPALYTKSNNSLSQVVASKGTTYGEPYFDGTKFIIPSSNGYTTTTDGESYRFFRRSSLGEGAFEMTIANFGGQEFWFMTTKNPASSASVLYRSSDSGLTWTEIPGINARCIKFGIVGGSPRIVVGGSNFIHSSTDGINWTNTSVSSFLSEACAIGNNNAVVVGGGGKIFASSDGVTWNQSVNGSGTTTNLNAVYYESSNNTWLSAGNSGRVLVTQNPFSTWNSRTTGVTSTFSSAVYFQNRWVLSAQSFLLISTDTLTWSSLSFVESNTGVFTIFGMGVGNEKLILSCTNRTIFVSNGDLLQTNSIKIKTVNDSHTFQDCIFDPASNRAFFVTFSASGNDTLRVTPIIMSLNTNSLEFKISKPVAPSSQGIFNIVKLNNFGFYAIESVVSSGERFFYSSDGDNWVALKINGFSSLISFHYLNGIYFAIERTNNSGTLFATSTDGLNFSNIRTIQGLLLANLGKSAPDYVLVTGKNSLNETIVSKGKFDSLQNDIVWQNFVIDPGYTAPVTDLVYNEKDSSWYAVSGNIMHTSKDGEVWKSVTSSSNLLSKNSFGVSNGYGGVLNDISNDSVFVDDNKLGISFNSDNFIFSLNGESFTTEKQTIDFLNFVIGDNLNGSLKSLRFLDESLPEQTLNSITFVSPTKE